mmetsp:Transcript_12800/g.27008  ORF Transcript_12800/g.27008 Transcript_12800/m.27008 type:complete len:225 (-) Transcript_12800:400-1074(-)
MFLRKRRDSVRAESRCFTTRGSSFSARRCLRPSLFAPPRPAASPGALAATVTPATVASALREKSLIDRVSPNLCRACGFSGTSTHACGAEEGVPGDPGAESAMDLEDLEPPHTVGHRPSCGGRSAARALSARPSPDLPALALSFASLTVDMLMASSGSAAMAAVVPTRNSARLRPPLRRGLFEEGEPGAGWRDFALSLVTSALTDKTSSCFGLAPCPSVLSFWW